jgi:uncharacterized protein YhaN
VRIVEIRIPAFGRLRELETGGSDLPGLVVVEGENEAGKSTFFEAVTSLLYGFLPATRDGNPFSPWGPGDAEIHARVELSDGSAGVLHRRLLATPRGSWRTGATELDLRNQPLPFTGHIPRKVYSQAFALTLAELASLEGDTWTDIQDRLLGGMGSRDLRSVREVVAELDGSASELWRSDRRGKPLARQLQERISELRKLRRTAVEEEREIRETAAELARLETERRDARLERGELQARLRRHDELAPARDDLARLETLGEAAGDPAELDRIPDAPRAELERLEARASELEARLEELAGALARAGQAADALTPLHRSVLAEAGAIEALVGRTAAVGEVRARLLERERDLADTEAEVEAQLRRVADRGATPEVLLAAAAISLPALEQALARLREAERTLVEAGAAEARAREDAAVEAGRQKEGAAGEAGPGGPDDEVGGIPVLPAWLVIAAFALALLSVAGWLATGQIPLLVGAVLLAPLGFYLVGQRNRGLALAATEAARRERERAEKASTLRELHLRAEAAARERADREEELESARAAYLALIAPLDPGAAAANPSGDMELRMERLQEQLGQRASLAGRIEQDRAAVAAFEAEAERLAHLVGTGGPDSAQADAEWISRGLQEALGAARDVARGAEAAAAKKLELEEELEATEGRLIQLREERSALVQALAALGGGDARAGLDEVESRLEARAAFRSLHRELLARHGELDALRARLADLAASGDELTELEVNELRVREAELGEESERLTGLIHGLEERLEHLGQRLRLDALDGELAEVESRLEDTLRRRDRLWVMARTVQRAERRVREAHQPGVLREAGRQLARLTRGRYDALVLGGEDGRSFRVQGPASPESRPIEPPLSTGTREQIYTALRLAILDQLDQAGERLPLLLDEVMVNWDDARREAGMDLLAEVARERQCFFFTCHPFMADALADRGARRIRLASPEVTPPGSRPPS